MALRSTSIQAVFRLRGFGWDGHYYDKDSGALVTNKFVEEYGRTYYVDEMVIRQLVLKEVNGAWY